MGKPTIGELIGRIKKQASDLEKKAFVPMGPASAPPMDPAMMGGGGAPVPMDPAMAGAGGGPPIDPAMIAALMGGGGGGMPPGPPPGAEGMMPPGAPPEEGGGEATSPEEQIRKVVREELDAAGVKRKKVDQDEVLLAILNILRAIASALNIPIPEEIGSLATEAGGSKPEENKQAAYVPKTPAEISQELARHRERAKKLISKAREKIRNS